MKKSSLNEYLDFKYNSVVIKNNSIFKESEIRLKG